MCNVDFIGLLEAGVGPTVLPGHVPALQDGSAAQLARAPQRALQVGHPVLGLAGDLPEPRHRPALRLDQRCRRQTVVPVRLHRDEV